MGAPKITLTLTGESAARLSRIIDEGGYESPEQALADVLDDLPFDKDPIIDAWLKDVVVNRYDASVADPSRSMDIAEARRRLLGRA